MIGLTQEQVNKVKNFSEEFKAKYLNTERGKKHIKLYEKERNEIKDVLSKLRNLDKNSEEFVKLVLYGLLPYNNSKVAMRVSTWPVFFDIKKFFKNKGYDYSEQDYRRIASAIFDFVDSFEKNSNSTNDLIKNFMDLGKYVRNFQAGTISPVLYCFNANFFVINSKTVDTINFILDEEVINSRLENYLENIKIIKELLSKLKISLFENYDIFDAFCHWMCSKRLGGYARLKEEELEIDEEETIIDTTDELSVSHEDAIGLLLELGNKIGYRTYTNHKSKLYKGKPLSSLSSEERIPKVWENIQGINRLDVIWIGGGLTEPHFFEVDDNGNVDSAMDKLYQVASELNRDVHIISPSKNRKKFDRCMEKAQYSLIKSRVKFKTFFELIKLSKQAEIYLPLQEDFFS